MPVTVKLSREFYDKFGNEVVNELVGLLNNMDATFRAELRELNEQNFQRFDAKLEHRLAEFASGLRAEMGTLRSDMATEIGKFKAEMGIEIGKLRAEMGNLKAELIKWMFLFWLGTVATMLGFSRFLV